MIEVLQLSKNFGSFSAVQAISFTGGKGEVIGFLGPNGAGKTTTIRMLTTALAPSAGTALVGGFDICTQAEQVQRIIGYLPENPALYNELTVTESLTFWGGLHELERRSLRAAIEQVIEDCSLSEVAHKLCGALSRGYRQRLGLAQALIHQPPVLILDEPTSGLDPRQVVEIRNLIRTLGETRTVLLSTHILSEVEMVCDKAVILSRGEVVLEQTVDEVRQQGGLEQVFIRSINTDELGRRRGGNSERLAPAGNA